MPTSITARLHDDKEDSLKDFLLRCAAECNPSRKMRDGGIQEVTPDTSYHEQALSKAEQKLRELKHMSLQEAEMYTIKAHNAAVSLYMQYKEDKEQLQKRYEDMLTKVEAWEPPSEQHEMVKVYAMKQLKTSIEHDCRVTFPMPVKQTAKDYIAEEKASYEKDVHYYKEAIEKEIASTTAENSWNETLLKSFK